MDNTLVINLTNVTQHPRVIHEDGTVDNVQILPKRRVELRAGMRICNNWVALNPQTVKVVVPQATTLPVKGDSK
jgi:hypothetical protein